MSIEAQRINEQKNVWKGEHEKKTEENKYSDTMVEQMTKTKRKNEI